MKKRLVIIESPFKGDGINPPERNAEYARECLRDSLRRGEAPFASHLLYTQVLDDTNPAERTQGIEAGLAWGAKADLTAVYTDRGISDGMRLGIAAAEKAGRRIEFRKVNAYNPKHFADPEKD